MAIEFPDKLAFLFEPHRYKVAYGGRGSGKSWSFARALLLHGAQKPLRILCTREIQKSIADSVHKLLADQIAGLGLGAFYDVQQAYIKGRNGTEFSFAGLQQHTIDSIKSYEGVDIVWVEEAHAVVKKSWDVLLPTIRKPGSEIWAGYNPQLESDETHQRFVITPPPDCVSVLMNYSDNPWFPEVLEQERLHAKATMKPEQYAHIWEGKCMPAVEGAIYFEQMSQAESRIGNVPHDGLLKTHVIFDLGWNDAMTIILAQKVAGEIRIVHYIEGHQRTLAEYSAELKGLQLDGQPINWGHVYLPHDGYAKRHQSGKSDAEVMGQLGWSVLPVPNMHVEQGINRVREVFPRTYFNRDRTARLVECLKRYRRQINQQTNEPGAPLHDEYSHGADVMRYLAIVTDQLSNDEWGGKLNYPKSNNA
ncbi:PBSX family phage terminase large subunit [Pseudomonas sp. BGI-2]|uniref:PBSX family phage terminase large subunit n=1 Tax=Pseudomonas sp. BGI-2 TaxID=2528211 RepID=UPI001034AB1C|nr:PBSX family phage terminase large subunit [Pseudomonas sp. BGI-2]TBN49172.1 PBSX family phage terminase large subunit [Pseudomonas sp. BGI-2]